MEAVIKISANEAKRGNILFYENELWTVSKLPEHVKPGKGPAYVQLELKSLAKGTKQRLRVNSNDTLDKAFLDQRDCQHLYWQGEDLILLDCLSYELITCGPALLEDNAIFLSQAAVDCHIGSLNMENLIIKLEFYGATPVNIMMPRTMILEVVDTVPAIKGSTVTSSYKPATLSNGLEIKVPPYIANGDKVVVNTEDRSFVERAK